MKEVIEYIMSNYTWFLGSLIIILLAVIGYYADKTKFGQGNSAKQDEEKIINLNPELQQNQITDLNNTDFKESSVNEKKQQVEESILDVDQAVDAQSQELADYSNMSSEDIKKEKINLGKNSIETLETFDNQFEDFDKEFNELLPEKNILDENILDDIDDFSFDKNPKFSFDKNQKFSLDSDFDLGELDLPKIKSFELDGEDVWKF